MNDWHVTAWVSAVCLWPLSVLCGMALLSKGYHDNWLQTFGLAGVMVWALGRAWTLTERALDGGEVSFYQALSHVALLSFAVGSWAKYLNQQRVTRSMVQV